MRGNIVEFDLDSDDSPDGHRPSERRPGVQARWWVVVVVAIGVVVSGAGLTRAWDSERTRQTRQRTVSLLVSVPSDAGLVGGGEVGGGRYQTTLLVINAGPLPITMDGVVTTAGSVSLRASSLNLLVPAGGSQSFRVDLFQECLRWLRSEPTVPLELRLDVTTADGVHRSQTRYLAVRETPWREVLEHNCRS